MCSKRPSFADAHTAAPGGLRTIAWIGAKTGTFAEHGRTVTRLRFWSPRQGHCSTDAIDPEQTFTWDRPAARDRRRAVACPLAAWPVAAWPPAVEAAAAWPPAV